MGVPYLRIQELKEKKEKIKSIYSKGSWIVHEERKRSRVTEAIKARFGVEAKILELGCGGGYTLGFLLSQGFFKARGVDIDNYLVDENLKSNLILADLNKEPIPASDASIDVLLAFEIFEHLENPWAIEREMARVLRPGGLLYLSTPHGHTIWDKLRFFRKGNLINFHKENNHITFLARDVFAKAFYRDFELIDTFWGHGWIPFLRPRRWNKLLPPHPWWSLKVCYVLKRK